MNVGMTGPRLLPATDSTAATTGPIGSPPAGIPSTSPAPKDALTVSATKGQNSAPPIDLGTGPQSSPEKPNPWQVTGVKVSFGVMPWNKYTRSDLHITNPDAGTHLTIDNAAAHQRTSFSHFYEWPLGWPQLDEPQTSIGAEVQFQNKFGLELTARHNKVVITNGNPDYPDQTLAMHGAWYGQPMNGTYPLSNVLPSYQLTAQDYQISTAATYRFPIIDQGNGKGLSLTLKAGPSLFIGTSDSNVRMPDGTTVSKEVPLRVQGFGGTTEAELSYNFGKGWAINAGEALSYAHLTNIGLADGSQVSQNYGASQVTLGISKTFKTKHQR